MRRLLDKYMRLLDSVLIRESLRSCALPIVLAPNKGGERRMCTKEERVINTITIVHWFPLLQTDDLMNHLFRVN